MKERLQQLMRSYERTHPEERMSIRQLAERANVSPQTIQRLMKGKAINDASKHAIAEALECEPADLMQQ